MKSVSDDLSNDVPAAPPTGNYIPNSAGVDYTQISDPVQRANWFYNQLATDPAFKEAYTNQVDNSNQLVAQRRANEYDDGAFFNALGSLTTTFVKSIPLIAGAVYGAGAMGLFGDGAAAAAGAGSAAGDVGLGSMAIDSGALQNLGFLDGMGVGDLSSTVGLGTGLGVGADAAAAAPAVADAGSVTIGAPAAAAGSGSVAAPIAAGLGAAGLGAMMGGGGSAAPSAPSAAPTPEPVQPAPDGSAIQGPVQSVTIPPPAAGAGLGAIAGYGSLGDTLGAGAIGAVAGATLPGIPDVTQGPSDGVHIPESDLPGPPIVPLVPLPPGSTPMPSDGSAAGNGDTGGAGGLPGSGGIPSIPGGGHNGGGLGGLGDLLGGLGSLYGAYNDHRNNAADTEFYKNQLAKMDGMYMPGTPEATLMEQKMNAQDAAAGRNSQYGTRAVNLAGALAQQRANILTSPQYTHTADMYRGKVDDNSNSWLNLLGQAQQGNTGTNSLLNGLGSLFNSGTGSTSGSNGNWSSWLNSLFNGGGSGSSNNVADAGTYVANNWLTS